MIDLSIVKDYKVLVVGDGILDEYVYVRPVGKSIKENVLSTVYEKEESFYGGVWAGAGHIRDFCAYVDVMVGDEVMVNRRFVDATQMHKLFTVHRKRNYSAESGWAISSYDVVIVLDFGHGFVTTELIKELTIEAKFLAVNAQTNSTNFGFNLITKFPRADLVVIDEIESRLAAHDRESTIEDIIKKLGFPTTIITLGKKGALGARDNKLYFEPAVTDYALDTMGSGDAFLCLTAPFAKAGLPMQDLLKIGNAAGAAKCAIVGHRSPVTREALLSFL